MADLKLSTDTALPTTSCRKYRSVLIGLGLVGLLVAIFVTPSTRQSTFRGFFANLSIGAPAYQTLFDATHPSLVLKGDYCAFYFSQSSNQFQEFIGQLGVSEQTLLSSSGALVTTPSKREPKHPWLLFIRAEKTNTPGPIYLVHIEGRQPYD